MWYWVIVFVLVLLLVLQRKEITRLQSGRFTRNEFNDLCHADKPMTREEFEAGCVAYQNKLYGTNDKKAL